MNNTDLKNGYWDENSENFLDETLIFTAFLIDYCTSNEIEMLKVILYNKVEPYGRQIFLDELSGRIQESESTGNKIVDLHQYLHWMVSNRNNPDVEVFSKLHKIIETKRVSAKREILAQFIEEKNEKELIQGALDLNGNKTIELPWRAFKAFYQLYCIENKVGTQYMKGKLYYSASPVPAFHSQSQEANKNKQILHQSGIIQFYSDSDGNFQAEIINEAAPLGFETKETSIVVTPMKSSSMGQGWIESQGHCAYCGDPLSLFGDACLSKVPETDKQLFNCRQCQGIKGKRSLSEFRIVMEQRQFKEEHGVEFSYEQLVFIRSRGMEPETLGFRDYSFNFEKEDQKK